MRIHLEDQNADDNLFGKVAFVGHRGSGKSIELLRLERDLAERFTSVHLYADQDPMGDFDYTDLLLWFAERTLENVEKVEKEIMLEAEAEAGAKLGWFGVGFGLLSRFDECWCDVHLVIMDIQAFQDALAALNTPGGAQ
jgi:hypothetical protein